jgi:hypothetical protein
MDKCFPFAAAEAGRTDTRNGGADKGMEVFQLLSANAVTAGSNPRPSFRRGSAFEPYVV